MLTREQSRLACFRDIVPVGGAPCQRPLKAIRVVDFVKLAQAPVLSLPAPVEWSSSGSKGLHPGKHRPTPHPANQNL